MVDAIGLEIEEHQSTPVQAISLVGEEVEPEQDERITPGTWEYRFAAKSPTTYAVARTAADIVPFGWALFPEARKEFQRLSPGAKALDLGLDVATVLPWGKLFKGVRTMLSEEKLGAWGARHFAQPMESLSVAEARIPEESVYKDLPVLEKIKRKWKLPEDEALALLEQRNDPLFWSRPMGRSGASVPVKPSKRFRARYTKTGQLKKEVKDLISYWSETPLIVQRADYYRDLWKQLIHNRTAKSIDLNEMFKYQLSRFTGVDAKSMSLDKASDRVMANLIAQALDHPRFISKVLDIGYQWITPTMILPARKAFGSGERFFKTHTIFKDIKELFSRSNKYVLQQTINFQQRLVDEGFGKFVTEKQLGKDVIVGFKRDKKILTKERWAAYGGLARKVDDLTSRLLERGLDADQVESIIARYIDDNADDVVKKLLLKVHKPFHDDLYKDFALLRLPQIVRMGQLTPRGEMEFRQLWEGESGLAARISSLFSQKYDPTYGARNVAMQMIVGNLRKAIKPSWYVQRGSARMTKLMDSIDQALTFSKGKKVGFPNYVENYSMRIRQLKQNMAGLKALSLKTKHASFVKARLDEEAADALTDMTQVLNARIAGQARELFLYPELPKHLRQISELPEGYRRFFDYWLGRMLNEPAEIDYFISQWLTRTTGGIMSLFGKPEVWTQRRVAELGHRLNDLAYLGGIGFKPYAAIRNLFQTILNVPTDLGGVKDTYWLLRGYRRALARETRDYIKSIGAIAEYVEELGTKPRVLDFGPSIAGKELPSMETLRDAGMWLFKKSDQFNRYVTGGAVLEKWEAMARRYLTPGSFNPKKFMEKMRFSGRDSWVRRELEELMSKVKPTHLNDDEVQGALAKAKAMFVSDVIADTQFLYGVAEAPTVAGRWGIISKTGIIFQSWWMNYLTNLEKWFIRSGSKGMQADRFFTWLISSAVAGELMVHGAGFKRGQALKSTFGGPFPTEVTGYMVPPTWTPFYEALGTVGDLAKLDPDAAKRRFKALGRSLNFFVPGGLQISKSIRETKKKGWEGLARSIINYYGNKHEKFLLGR